MEDSVLKNPKRVTKDQIEQDYYGWFSDSSVERDPS
jgi:hypothetical protein